MGNNSKSPHLRYRNFEEGACCHSWKQGRYRVALVYPNSYQQGMGNLGFHTVYHLINQRDDSLCERFFLPESSVKGVVQPLTSVESGRLLTDFDLIALSVSFENDLLHVPAIFAAGKIPLYADQRHSKEPLVLFGGVCAFINPEPFAPIADLVAVGEAEAILPSLLGLLQQQYAGKKEQLLALAQLDGVYVPGFYRPRYSATGVTFQPQAAVPERVRRQYLVDLDSSASRTRIHTEAAEFGNMSLIEVARGCSRGCRFCAAGFVYLPPRERSLQQLVAQIDEGLCRRNRIGLVAAAVADHRDFLAIQQHIIAGKGEIAVASLRLDAINAAAVALLREAGHETVAIAPEAGSQRLRNIINKGFSEEQILSAVQLLGDGGIRNLKLYFLIGLPFEEMADIEALVGLVQKIAVINRAAGRKRGIVGTLAVSVNPFIPKPFTPFQWAGMEDEKLLKKKKRYLQAAVSQIPNSRFSMESIRLAQLQGLLSRGDRRIAALLPALADGVNVKQICNRAKWPLLTDLTRERDQQEDFPWEIIDSGVQRSYLWKEYQCAALQRLTAPCAPGCRRCGVC